MDRIFDELYNEFKDEIKKRERVDKLKRVKNNLSVLVEDVIEREYNVKGRFSSYDFRFVPNDWITVKGVLELPDKDVEISLLVNFDEDGYVNDYRFQNTEKLKKDLGVKEYAVRVGKEVYKVEGMNEKVAVKKLLANLIRNNKRIVKGNKIYDEKDIDWLVDELVSSGNVVLWKKFVSSSDKVSWSDEEVPQIYEYDVELEKYSSIKREETKDIVDRILENEISLHKHIYNVLNLKKVIASVIEGDLSVYGIDAVVNIREIDEGKLYKLGTEVKGIAEVYSSYVNAVIPFRAEIDENGFVKKVLYRDKEIKKIASLKVYSVNINGKEYEILATGIPVVLETMSKMLGRNLTIDELIEKYSLKEKGVYARLVDDSKEVNPWRVVNVGEDTYILRMK